MSDENQSESRIDDLVEKLVYFPVGVAAAVAKALPDAASNGKSLVEGQLKTAEFLGRVGVQYAKKRYETPEALLQDLSKVVAKSVGGTFGDALSRIVDTVVGTKATVSDGSTRVGKDGVSDGVSPAGDKSRVGGIKDYDSLTASQVIGALEKCSPEELSEVESYELEHRRRRTVLARLSQYRDASSSNQ